MNCKACGKDHDGSFGSGNFCSRSCSNSRGPRTDDFKKRVSEKLRGKPLTYVKPPLSEETKKKIGAALSGREITKHAKILPDDSVFVANSTYARGAVKKRIIRKKLIEYKCELCKIDSWQGQKLSLHLDHINGINNDHRLENLRFLCPNCHSLQDTYAGKNVKLKRLRRQSVTEAQLSLK